MYCYSAQFLREQFCIYLEYENFYSENEKYIIITELEKDLHKKKYF